MNEVNRSCELGDKCELGGLRESADAVYSRAKFLSMEFAFFKLERRQDGAHSHLNLGNYLLDARERQSDNHLSLEQRPRTRGDVYHRRQAARLDT